MDYAKGVGTLCEYALATTAAQPELAPAKVVELMDALLALNPKSTYVGAGAAAYLAALGKMGGADKQIEGANKIIAANPNEEYALMTLADNLISKNRADQAYTYATRLVTVMKAKAKPEGYSDEDWNRVKSTLLSRGYYDAGVAGCVRQIWKDCDTNLRAAIPMIGPIRAVRPGVFLPGRGELPKFQDHHRPHQASGSPEVHPTIGGDLKPHAGPGAAVRDGDAERTESARRPAVTSPISLHCLKPESYSD